MRTEFETEYINVLINYEPVMVRVKDYVEAKTKDLKEFGYNSLKESEVLKSTWRVVNKEQLTDVIDHFIKEDIEINP